ncbi:MAG TPA: TonB-dependent receptor [Novosphingobium sp.]|nr:TonB-dependent receptor [Novosphingobium sp.]
MTTGISFARALLLSGLAAGAFAAQPALAQDATADASPEAEAEEATGGEIIVTARRREESLIDVPIAITAIGGEQLERAGAIDITEVANFAPNVTLEPSRATNSTLSAFIRGVGQQDPVAGFEQGVGIYLDDVYLNRPQAAVLDIYDVERIEVLRGPQGTLYGRNTVGGAVKYVTRRLADRPTVSARATYGEYDQADGVLTVGLPVGDGTLRFGGSIARLTRDGFGKNLTTGEDNYDKDVWGGRVSAEVHADNFFARLAGDYTRDNSNPRGGHRLIPSQFTNAPVLDDVYDTRGGLADPKQKVTSYGAALFMEGNPSDIVTLRSITSWRRDRSSTPIDFDALPTVDVDVPGRYRNRQVSQELQVLVDTGRFNGLLGGYYLDAKAVTPFDVRLFTTLAGFTAFTNADVRTNTLAGFADLTYDLTDQLSLSAGGRYTWDERRANILRQSYLGGGSPEFGGAGIPVGAPSTNFKGKRSFTKFTPRASVSFKPTPDHNIYASYSQGFKGGGFDPRGVGTNAPDLNANGIREDSEVAAFLSFAPEKVDSYEVGYKGSLLDRRLLVALAAFRADYSDVQIPGSSACTVLVGGVPTTSFCGVVTNAGKARFTGFEAELNGRAGEDMLRDGDTLRFNAAVGYIDAEFREYITNIASKPTDVADFRQVQNTPKWTFSQSTTYSTPIGAGDLDLTQTIAYRSKTYQFEVPNPFIDQEGYAILDASVVYRAPGNRWSLGLYGKNLTDKQYKTSGYNFMSADPTTGVLVRRPNGTLIPALGREGVLTAFYGAPRQIFVTATFKY